uniref:Putative rRNA maturation factor n=1 Tax=Lygus hesperus TaxID=30085 RepID=A0A0A9VVE0_LYGHE
MFYCDEREQDKCPEEFTVSGGRKWEEAPPDDDPTEFEDDKWELKIKGMTIICVTSDVKYCKKVHKGKWKPSNRGIDDDGVPENSRWEISTGDAKVYCDAKSAKHCPKLKKGKWGPAEEPDEPGDEPEDELGMNKWELTLSGKTIICVAHSVNECKKIHKGHWKHCTKNHCNEDSKWWIPKDKTRVYCNEESHKSCPKVHGGHGWEKNPGNPDEPAPMWQLKGKGEKLICMAFNAKDCKKSHKGQWKRRSGGRNADGVPNKAKWWLIVGKVRVFCDKNSKKSCPKVDKGKDEWHEILGGSDEENDSEQIYELGVGGETFVCRARNVEDCKKFREGVWKPNKDRKEDANGVPEGSNWFVPVGESKVYCYKKSTKSCPIVGKGEEWQKVPGGAGEESVWTNFTNDDRDVDAGKNRTRSDFRWTI